MFNVMDMVLFCGENSRNMTLSQRQGIVRDMEIIGEKTYYEIRYADGRIENDCESDLRPFTISDGR